MRIIAVNIHQTLEYYIIMRYNDVDNLKMREIKIEILEACPDISKVTVERTLSALVNEGFIVKIGAGRSTAYGKTGKNYSNQE